MNLLSERDARSELETLSLSKSGPDPSREETFDAAFGFAQDEMLSISGFLNNQGFWDRSNKINQMKADGFDFTPYTNERGQIDYNNLAANTNLIKTDGDLRTERNEILGERRAYNQDIMDRGPASSTFLGMAGAMLFNDPINLATLPIGFGTAAKGLSVLGHTLRGARNTAAVAVASELAIQPLVFTHKHDINSPYEVEDAVAVIAFTAATAGILGGTIGGIGGYFTRAAEVAAAEAVRFTSIGQQIPASVYGRGFSIRPNPMEFVQLTPTGATAQKLATKFVKFTPTGRIDPRYRPTFESVSPEIIAKAKVELTGLAAAKLSRGRVKAIEKEILELSQARNKLTRANIMRNSTGKIITTQAIAAKSKPIRTKRANEAAEIQVKIDKLQAKLKTNEGFSRAQADLNKLNQGIIPAPIQKEIDAVLKQSEVGESARVMQRMADSIVKERGFVASDLPLQIYKIAKNGGKTNVEAKAMAIKSLNETIANVKTNKQTINGVVQPNKELAKLEELKVNLEKTSPEELDDFMAQLHKTVVDNDMAIMQSMVYRQAQASKPNIKPSDYELVPVPDSPRAKTTSLERAALDRDGIGKEFDYIMAEYSRLPEKKLYNEAGELIDADDVIKAADDELNGLESIMRCSIG
jgi:hypothetical protein